MGALGVAAGVAVDLDLRRGAVHAGVGVLGVAVSGGGEFGQDCVQGGPQFGVDPPGELAHAVEFLAAQAQPALAGMFGFVVEGAVLVEVAHQLSGDLA